MQRERIQLHNMHQKIEKCGGWSNYILKKIFNFSRP